MGSGNRNQNGALENLRKQLALAVKSLEWSYAIFWSISAKQPGALEWNDGFYNGDIKTRKTVQAVESKADHLGLQRSDQLRELFESLSQGETSPQPNRPTAALSPEDLTDAEWYFMVCMSFMFNIGQGLPGRSLAQNETVWLCNAHYADTKVFARSLLAKSASIQTVVCFPYLGGVMELGTTELVLEDPIMMQRIKTYFLESSSTIVSAMKPGKNLDRLSDFRDAGIISPHNSSDDFPDNFLREESNFANDVCEEGSQMQRQFKDNNSMSSGDCVSQTLGNPEANIPSLDENKATDDVVHENQECNEQKHGSSGFQGDDGGTRYQILLSNLLRSSHQLILGPYLGHGNRKSSFVSWKNTKPCSRLPQTGTRQRLLKKVLFEVPRMHEKNSRASSGKQHCDKKDNFCRQDGDEGDKTHVLSERRRREKISERLMILGSLVPSGSKVDKVSILDHTIDYIKELERKVDELESYKGLMELETKTTQSEPHGAMEGTSGNYGPKETGILNARLENKRKACDADKTTTDHKRVRPQDSSKGSVILNTTEKGVSIDIRCGWREFVLVEVMEAITKLHLDTQTVQSSIAEGILSLTIKAECKELKGPSPGVIRQVLQKIIRKS